MICHLSTRRKRIAEGSTILEAMAAMFLVMVLVLAVYGAISSGISTVRMARENLRATQILLDKLEAIRLYHWGQLDPTFIPSTFVANYDVNSTSTNNGVLYHGTITIEPADVGTTYADTMKLVTVRLKWSTGHIQRNREVSTFICRSGLQNYMF